MTFNLKGPLLATRRCLGVALLYLHLPLVAAQDINPDNVIVSIAHVRGPIYVITGEGGNIGVSVGKDGVFVIDDQYAPLVPQILRAIREVSVAPIRFVINTHWHWDHAGGNEAMVISEGAMLIAHDNTRHHLRADWEHPWFGMIRAAPEAAWPIVTFNKEISLHLNGEEARLIHIPNAHTDSDVLVWFRKSNVIHAGDAFLVKYPLIDWPSGGTIDGFLAGYDRLFDLANDETLIISGHGPIARKSDVAYVRDAIRTIRDRIEVHIEKGLNEDEVVAANPTAEWDEVLEQPPFVTPESLTRTIYHTLRNASDHLHE